MTIEDKVVLEKMLEAMSVASNYDRDTLLGHGKTPPKLCACRYFIWYHLHNDKRWSFPEIARPFGRNHATILYGVRKVDDILTTPNFDAECEIYDEFINNLCVLL